MHDLMSSGMRMGFEHQEFSRNIPTSLTPRLLTEPVIITNRFLEFVVEFVNNSDQQSSTHMNQSLDLATSQEFSSLPSTINSTNSSLAELPIDMQFNQGHLLSIIAYSILFAIAAVGNISLLITIIRFRMKTRLSRVNLFLLHLAIADLMVTFLLMPLEIGWAATVSWEAGDAACRILSFFRTFGLYLSGFLLVCISLDRYFAILKPLSLPEANRRGRILLYLAWTGSFLGSLPQALIFHVERHPDFTWFEQCVTFNFFSSSEAELAYNIFVFIIMFGFPLTAIIFCYTCILYEIFKIHQIHRMGEDIRRSNVGTLGRAKIRTLKMTIVIVATFFLCWTPYNIMCLWYWIDRTSALKVDQRVQKGLFLFAVTNSCFNPIVYGLFHIRRKLPGKSRTPAPNGNTYRSTNTNKQSCKFRVRWKPRAECLCAPHTSTASSSSRSHPNYNYARAQRPMYELNGVPVYLNNTGHIHSTQNGDPRSLLCLTNKETRGSNAYASNSGPWDRDCGGSKRRACLSNKACNMHSTWRNSCGGLNVTEDLALFPLTKTNVFEDKSLMLQPIVESVPVSSNPVKRPTLVTNDLEKNHAACCSTCNCDIPGSLSGTKGES